jgi:predicted nucleotidyltransferase
MDKLIILQKLRKLKPVLQQNYGLSEIALFGSYSRDEQTQESDIDIMVDFSSPIGIEYFNLVYSLNDAFKNCKVQVVSKKGIKQKCFDRLKQDLLYA